MKNYRMYDPEGPVPEPTPAHHTNGTTLQDGEQSPQLTALLKSVDLAELWRDWPPSERLKWVMTDPDPATWFTRTPTDLLGAIAHFRDHPLAGTWGTIKERFRQIGGNPYDLEHEVDKLRQTERTPTSPPTDTPRFETMSAPDLYGKTLPEPAWIVPEILPAGATLFVGRGKDGKSLMAWNLCLAVATGGKALSRYDVTEGDVLYLALEDGERRAQKRLRDQMRAAHVSTPPARLDLVLWDAPRIGEGFEAALTTWLDEHAEARLVVIDILEKVRPKRTRNGSVYADDYAALAPLQRIAQERNIAILVVHHSNKTRAEDFRDSASGSMGLIAAPDTVWALKRVAGEPDAALHVIGRDVDTQELALQFQDGFWTALGNAEEYRMSQTSKAVLQALKAAGKPLTPKQLAGHLGWREDTTRKHLTRMLDRGEVLNLGDGRYIPRSTPFHPYDDDSGGDDGREVKGAATGATGATPATQGDNIPASAPEWQQSGIPDGAGATLASPGKDGRLDSVSGRVAGVAPAVQSSPEVTSIPVSTLRCPTCGEQSPRAVKRLDGGELSVCPVCDTERQEQSAMPGPTPTPGAPAAPVPANGRPAPVDRPPPGAVPPPYPGHPVGGPFTIGTQVWLYQCDHRPLCEHPVEVLDVRRVDGQTDIWCRPFATGERRWHNAALCVAVAAEYNP